MYVMFQIQHKDHKGRSSIVHCAINNQLDTLSVLLQSEWSSDKKTISFRNKTLVTCLVSASTYGYNKVRNVTSCFELIFNYIINIIIFFITCISIKYNYKYCCINVYLINLRNIYNRYKFIINKNVHINSKLNYLQIIYIHNEKYILSQHM